ncbi:MAG: cysteine desulfurase family protein [Candidatus Poribacteria bacterium]|nr:cysteine desulfurase family protein [Candidatus Poribacteria bacterium]
MDNRTIIYLDYQATTPLDPLVVEKMNPFWGDSFGNPHSSDHIIGWQAEKAVTAATESIANLIGADSDEVIFTSGATEANNLALLGLARRAPKQRHRILVSAIEHKCVLEAAQTLEKQMGLIVDTIPVGKQGRIDIDALERLLDDTVLVVSVMAVNNEIGTIQDIPKIASLLKSHDILFHCDAAQAPSAMDLRDLATHTDLASLSAHKIYGPQGIGALYICRDIQNQVEPLIYGGSQQRGLRSGTIPVALCVGMGVACDILTTSEITEERMRVAKYRDAFVELLQDSSFPVIVNGPNAEDRHPGNANLQFPNFDAHEILAALQPRLAASTGSACTSGTPQPSHVLRAIGLTKDQSESSIRFSFGRFTSNNEIEKAVLLVRETLDRLESESYRKSA